jgi:endonuclease/exonuclease/phosphatase family metal-dependent hydrolase
MQTRQPNPTMFRNPCLLGVVLFGGFLSPLSAALTVMHYNVKGNGAANWNTNAAQVQAIGRQITYLNPDVIAFNEIPVNQTHYMTNWSRSFLSNYNLVISPGSDGFIRSAIASRFPITRSKSWLDGTNLAGFGYNGGYTRDLFEAQIAVPGYPQPLHVFTSHLKCCSDTTSALRRGAEASAISNFLVTAFLTTNSLHTYLLTGDLNEDIARPDTNSYTSSLPIQRLTSAPTGLRLTTPENPFSASELTLSIQGTLDVRFDYVLPCALLSSNIAASQVFRSDLLPSPPPPLLPTDTETASDHLPVLMTFNNPYDKPFQLLSFTRSNLTVTLKWESVPGQPYRVESSTNLNTWSPLSPQLLATGSTFTYATNLSDTKRYFRVYRAP